MSRNIKRYALCRKVGSSFSCWFFDSSWVKQYTKNRQKPANDGQSPWGMTNQCRLTPDIVPSPWKSGCTCVQLKLGHISSSGHLENSPQQEDRTLVTEGSCFSTRNIFECLFIWRFYSSGFTDFKLSFFFFFKWTTKWGMTQLFKIISSSISKPKCSLLFLEAYGISHVPLILALTSLTKPFDNPNKSLFQLPIYCLL